MGWNFNRYFQFLNNAQVCPLFSLLHITWRKPSCMKMIIFCFILCILYINASDLRPRMLELVTGRLIHVAVNCLILCAQLNYQLTGAPQPSWRGQCWRWWCTTTSVWLAWTSPSRLPTSSPRPLRPEQRPASAPPTMAWLELSWICSSFVLVKIQYSRFSPIWSGLVTNWIKLY